MPRITLTQLLMATALAAILLSFTQTEGCGRKYARIECVSFSSDGSRIAVSKLNARNAPFPRQGYKADVSRTLSVLETSTGDVARVVHAEAVPGNAGVAYEYWRGERTSAVFLPGSDRLLAVEFGGGNVVRHDLDRTTKPVVVPLEYLALNIAVSRSGRLAAASGMSQFTVFDTTTGKPVMRGAARDLSFLQASLLAFSEDESRLVVGGDAGIHVWNIATGTYTKTGVRGEWYPSLHAIAIAPNDTMLVCADDWVRRYDFAGTVVATLNTDAEKCYECVVSDDGEYAAVTEDGDVKVYSLDTGRRSFSVRHGSAELLAFSPGGHALAVGDWDGKVSLLDVHTKTWRWKTSPPGTDRWQWTVPAVALAVWSLGVWLLSRRAKARYDRLDTVPLPDRSQAVDWKSPDVAPLTFEGVPDGDDDETVTQRGAHVNEQLSARPPITMTGPEIDVRVYHWICRAVKDSIGWSTDRFVAADPSSIVFYGYHDPIDAIDAILVIESRFSIEVKPIETFRQRFPTFGDLVEYILANMT